MTGQPVTHRLPAKKYFHHGGIVVHGSDTLAEIDEMAQIYSHFCARLFVWAKVRSGHCAAARERPAKGQLVGELQVAAHRQTRTRYASR